MLAHTGMDEQTLIHSFFTQLRSRDEYRDALLVIAVENNSLDNCTYLCTFCAPFEPCHFIVGDPNRHDKNGGGYNFTHNPQAEGIGILSDNKQKLLYAQVAQRLIHSNHFLIRQSLLGSNVNEDLTELQTQLARTKLYAIEAKDPAFNETRYGVSGKEGKLQDDLAISFCIGTYVATALAQNDTFTAACINTYSRMPCTPHRPASLQTQR